MNIDQLRKIINQLSSEREDVKFDFLVKDYPNLKNHKIGLDKNDNLCLLIKSKDGPYESKIKLDSYKHIRVLFDQTCEIVHSKTNNVIISNYTVIYLLDDDFDMQIYFLHVCTVLIGRLGNYPTLETTHDSIKYLLELFSKIIIPAKNSIQGLWAELLLIDKSSDVDYMINAWHVTYNDRFDFNEGVTKLEVKSTSKPERIHRFSLNQLHSNQSSDLMIASVMVLESGLGTSVFDLIQSIELKIKTIKCLEKLHEIVFESLGNLTSKILSVKYDKLYSLDHIRYFNYKDIPSICKENIPNNMTNIKFDINLENTTSIINNLKSKLIS